MLFIIGGELRDVRFSPAITDKDWVELEKLSALPPEARFEIDEAIGYCREVRDDATGIYCDHWFTRLSAVIKAEKDSKKALDRMIADPQFFDAIAMGLYQLHNGLNRGLEGT